MIVQLLRCEESVEKRLSQDQTKNLLTEFKVGARTGQVPENKYH